MLGEILSSLVQRVPGAIGAVFLDREGEAITHAATEMTKHDALVIGAYGGIYLSSAPPTAGGGPLRLLVEWSSVTMIASPLRDGYYVLILLRRPYIEGVAVRELEKACALLTTEI
jgi:hypothetical protein